MIKNLLLVLSTGYIFMYFSEHLFWAHARPDDTLGGWLGAWIAYSFLAYVFLSLLIQFRINNAWTLFLAGAAFGWMAEGIIVQTAYAALPLSISFTGLAWHALITVWIGWYAMQRSLRSSDSLSTVKLAAVIGFCSGLWAISWWLEPDGGVASFAEYAAFNFITCVLAILAYRVAHWGLSGGFSTNRWVALSVLGLFALYFFTVAVPSAPIAIFMLPVLLGSVYVVLRRSRDIERDDSLLNLLAGRIPAMKYLSILALPVASLLVYGFALKMNLRWHTNWILYLITTPLGFILLGSSLYRSWRKNQPLDTPSILQIIMHNRRAKKGSDGGKYIGGSRQEHQGMD